MFGLGADQTPSSKEELVESIEVGLRDVLRLSGREVVTAVGEWPSLELLRVDVTDAQASVDRSPPDFRWMGRRTPAFTAERLEVLARPMRVGPAALTASLLADGARFEFDRDRRGRPLLVLAAARRGTARASMPRGDLDALAREAATHAAAPHGVSISSIDLELKQLGPLSISASARVRARKLFLMAAVHVGARIDLDAALCARLSEMRCAGEGVLGEIACVGIRSHLNRLENETFPISALGDLRLHEVSVGVGDALRLEASFGQ